MANETFNNYRVPPGEDLSYMPATFTPLTPEERRQRVAELNQRVKDNVERIQNSAEFRNFLIAQSRFHNYSWNNQMLIWLQKKDASHVAGYNTWRDLGRYVKKGEKGISILAPLGPTMESTWRRATDGATAEIRKTDTGWGISGSITETGFKSRAEAARRLKDMGFVEHKEILSVNNFKVVAVFDISQTDGKPLPEFDVPALTGEANPELFDGLLRLAQEQNVTVSFESRPNQDPGIKGSFSAPSSIWIRPEEAPAQQLKTLAHELAHYYSVGVFRIPRGDAETIAESSAYIVGAHYGFDTGVRSFPYVALWAKDEKTLRANLNSVQEVAEKIIDALEQRKARLMPQTRRRADYVPASYPTLIAEVEATHSLEELKRMACSKGLPADGPKRQIANELIKAGAFPRALK